MISWNPRIPSSWANLFGFVAVPLFGRQRAAGLTNHFVLLDGRRSSLTFSVGNAESLLSSKRPLEWAWSSNVPRSVIVDEATSRLYAVRWDSPGDVRETGHATPEAAKTILSDLEFRPREDIDTSISKAVGIFRSVREEVRLLGGDDFEATRAFTILLLLADSMRQRDSVQAENRSLGEIASLLTAHAPKFFPSSNFRPAVADLQIVTLAKHLLSQGENYSLDPYLLIRHASGTLFQEAHIEIDRPKIFQPKLFVSLDPNMPKPSGTPQRDAHYTPTPLARFLGEQAIQEFVRLNPDVTNLRILDPACGSGVFLVEALRELEGRSVSVRLSGFDTSRISKLMADFALESASIDFRAAGGAVEADVEVSDSLERQWNDPDIILMNPPFLPWDRLTSNQRQQVKRVLGNLYHGKADTALAFLAKAVRQLKPGAVLATVIPAAMLQSKAALKLRQFLGGTGWNVSLIGRARDYGYFSNAMVEPAFLVVSRATNQPRTTTRTVLAESEATDRAIRAARITPVNSGARDKGWEVNALAQLDPNDWSPRPSLASPFVEKLRSQASVRNAGSLFNTRLGIRTGDNSVFIVSDELFNRMGRSEQQWFRPIANSIKRGQVQNSRRVFYPYRDGRLAIRTLSQLTEQLPIFFNECLRPNEKDLKNRSSLRDRQWWELVEPRTTWLRFGKPRIVTMTFGRRGSFALDEQGQFAVVQGQAWLSRNKSLSRDGWLAYVAIFNSGLFEGMLDYFCPRTQGGQYELAPRYLKRLPLVDISRLASKRTRALTQFGEKITKGQRVPLRSLDEVVAASYGVGVEEFRDAFPPNPATRDEAEFERLASIWRKETEVLSSSQQKSLHPAMREMLAMGAKVVPLILRELISRPSWWFSALSKLTGEDPVPSQSKGLLRESADAWLKWGRENGYEL